jgi:hypothetical protein
MPIHGGARQLEIRPPSCQRAATRGDGLAILSLLGGKPSVWSARFQRRCTERQRLGWPNYTFGFQDSEDIGAGLLGEIAKKTGLRPEDL